METFNFKINMSRGSISIPAALVGSLLGSVLIASASYFSAITSQKVQATELQGQINLVKSTNDQTNTQQNIDISKINDNIVILNDNISALLIERGIKPKQIRQ